MTMLTPWKNKNLPNLEVFFFFYLRHEILEEKRVMPAEC
jgi:hypothetical protein